MAYLAGSFLGEVSKKDMNYNSFKEKFTSRINWTRRKWSMTGEQNTKLHKMVKKSKYWFGELVKADVKNAFVFTLYKEGLDYKPNVMKILKEFKQKCGTRGLAGFSVTRNTSFMVLEFESIQYKKLAEKLFTTVEDYFVVNSEWVKNNEIFDIEVQWLPTYINLKKVENFLKEYLNIEWLNHKYVQLDNDLIKTGRIIGRAKFKESVALSEIPYFLTINEYVGHILIWKRKVICFNCQEIGHIKAQCKFHFCKFCKKRLHKKHTYIVENKEVLSGLDSVGNVNFPNLSSNLNLINLLEVTAEEKLCSENTNTAAKTKINMDRNVLKKEKKKDKEISALVNNVNKIDQKLSVAQQQVSERSGIIDQINQKIIDMDLLAKMSLGSMMEDWTVLWSGKGFDLGSGDSNGSKSSDVKNEEDWPAEDIMLNGFQSGQIEGEKLFCPEFKSVLSAKTKENKAIGKIKKKRKSRRK